MPANVMKCQSLGLFQQNNVNVLLFFKHAKTKEQFWTVDLDIYYFHVRILTSFGAGDVGTEVDFLYTMMWVTKVTF